MVGIGCDASSSEGDDAGGDGGRDKDKWGRDGRATNEDYDVDDKLDGERKSLGIGCDASRGEGEGIGGDRGWDKNVLDGQSADMGYDADDEDFGDRKDEGGCHNDNERGRLYAGEEGYNDAGITF